MFSFVGLRNVDLAACGTSRTTPRSCSSAASGSPTGAAPPSGTSPPTRPSASRRSPRRVRRVAEADRLPHPLVADGAADLSIGCGESLPRYDRQVRMGRERLRILLVALLVDRQMARLAPIHLRHADEVHVVDDVRQDDLLDLDRRRHEVEQRRVAEVVLHDARRDDVEPLLAAASARRSARRSASAIVATSPVYFAELCLQRARSAVDLLDVEVQLGEPLLLLGDRLAPARPRSARRSPRAASKS